MMTLGQGLFLYLTKCLYNELLLRCRNCDRRWSLRRKKLIERAGIPIADYSIFFGR